MFQERDVFVVMDGEERASPGHLFVILGVNNSQVFFSNITDYEKEDESACLIVPDDDTHFISKKSTFRYQSIQEHPIESLTSALQMKTIKCLGKLSCEAFRKIIEGIRCSKRIKPKHRTALLAIHGGKTAA